MKDGSVHGTGEGEQESAEGRIGLAALRVRCQEPDNLVLEVAGDWRSRPGLPGVESLEAELAGGFRPRRLLFVAGGLERWDSGLLVFLIKCRDWSEKRGIEFVGDGLPAGARRLFELARAVPAQEEERRGAGGGRWVERIGMRALGRAERVRQWLVFLGELVLGLGRLVRGRAQYRWPDAFWVMQQCGPKALGIVALISGLVGMIMAFVGAVQLVQFGASIYVADLVAIAMVREMGSMMTAVIMCGRTGAAFAAQLGTMKVNEEIDAFRTFGISPMDFLVLPRVVALVLMMPLLCVFADLVGILGGFGVALSMLDLTLTEYWHRTVAAISLTNFLLGIVKGAAFGLLLALSGCLRGTQCGSNAAAVGEATTSAVVTGITAIIVADAIFAVLCNALGI